MTNRSSLSKVGQNCGIGMEGFSQETFNTERLSEDGFENSLYTTEGPRITRFGPIQSFECDKMPGPSVTMRSSKGGMQVRDAAADGTKENKS